jgi:nitrogen regulatory protein PII
MKYVVAIIKPFKFDAVRDALTGLGTRCMQCADQDRHRGHDRDRSNGFGQQKGRSSDSARPSNAVSESITLSHCT